jgi:trehalose utilization protein
MGSSFDSDPAASPGRLRVTVWGENLQDRDDPAIRALYPAGIHGALAAGVRERLPAAAVVRTSTFHDDAVGLADALLDETDVLVMWGHLAHDDVPDDRAQAVQERVLAGMGFVVLHSSHLAKPFRLLMGTGCNLRFGPAARAILWNVAPSHPITEGVGPFIAIERDEVYCEFFDIPSPDELVFITSFATGEAFRGGACFSRGAGRVFYFSPGHEEFPIYHHEGVLTVIANGVRWASNPDRSGVRLPGIVRIPGGWLEAAVPESAGGSVT